MIDINVASSPVYTVNINLIYSVDKPDRYQPLTSPVYTVYLKFILSNILGFLFVCQITKKTLQSYVLGMRRNPSLEITEFKPYSRRNLGDPLLKECSRPNSQRYPWYD